MQIAPAEVIPDSEPAVDESGTQPVTPNNNDTPPRRLRGWMIAAAVAVLGAILLVVVLSLSTRKTLAGENAAPALSNNPGQILRLKRTTEAAQSRAILTPLLAGP